MRPAGCSSVELGAADSSHVDTWGGAADRVPVGIVVAVTVAVGVAAQDSGTSGESATAAIAIQPAYRTGQGAIDDALAADIATATPQPSSQEVQEVRDSIDDGLTAAGR